MNLLDVKVGFTETDAPNVHVGQAATITLDALPNQTFTGHVIELDANSTLVSNVVTYYARVAFDTPSAGVKPGMTASVNVVLQKVDERSRCRPRRCRPPVPARRSPSRPKGGEAESSRADHDRAAR